MADEIINLEGNNPYGEPVGRCIYCGSDGGTEGLRDEHIIAFSLGSDAYLPKASCSECEKETSYLEGYAARAIFGPLRVFFGIQSRRKKVDLANVPVVFDTCSGQETRDIPRSALPVLLTLPILEPPGLFHGLHPNRIANEGVWLWAASDPAEHMRRFSRAGDKGWHISLGTKSSVFARVLAKIAHTMSVARFGIDSFHPYLPSLILGENENTGYLIGGAAGPTEPAPPLPQDRGTRHHHISLAVMKAEGDKAILVSTIRLFSFTGSPTYFAIVGEPGAGLLNQLDADLPLQLP